MKDSFVNGPDADEQRERRFRLIFAGVAAAAVVLALGICGAFLSVAPSIINRNSLPTRLRINVTGTISRIAGMPMPADAHLISHTPRSEGGLFVYQTRHTPEQLYIFYLFMVKQIGGWLAGTQPQIGDTYGEFRFYPGTVPRLTIIKASCEGDLCTVNVEY